MEKIKSIQIPEELFSMIGNYFLNDCRNQEVESLIIKGLLDKLEKMAARELYSKYKNEKLSDSERDSFRREYLQQKGINPDFIWSMEYELQR